MLLDNNTYKLSVITVVYNNVSELQATINSILNQTYKNIEYIVIDGGSTDGTVDIIKENSEYISYWISERDAGIYDAMNKGVNNATGDYVIFMNAGDAFYSCDSLSIIFERLNGEQPDVIMASYSVHSAMRRNGIRRCRALTDLWKGMITCHQAIIFSRKNDINHRLNAGLAADYRLVVDMYMRNAVFKLFPDVILADYSGGGVSDVNQHTVYASWFNIAKELDASWFKVNVYYSIMYARSLCRFYLLKVLRRLHRGC